MPGLRLRELAGNRRLYREQKTNKQKQSFRFARLDS